MVLCKYQVCFFIVMYIGVALRSTIKHFFGGSAYLDYVEKKSIIFI